MTYTDLELRCVPRVNERKCFSSSGDIITIELEFVTSINIKNEEWPKAQQLSKSDYGLYTQLRPQ